MRFSKERVEDTWVELYALMLNYYERTEGKNGVPPLDYNWPAYFELEKQDSIELFTARETASGELIGFALYFVLPHLHHKTTIYATADTLAVGVDHRGKGFGRLIVEYAIPHLKKRHVRYVTHGFRTVYASKPLFPSIGFELIEHTYMKELG